MSSTNAQQLRFDDRAAFRAWAAQQPRRRWEREDGVVIAMSPERLDHIRIKARTWAALTAAIQTAGVSCEALADGATIEIDEHTDYEPDAVVTCGEREAGGAVAVHQPIIVVEVLSPSTAYRDVSSKLAGYFSVPSVQHYLIVAADERQVVRHSRRGEGPLATTIHHDGRIDLHPPGLRIEIADLYIGTELDEER